jgi:hypothetical protein
LESLFYHSKHLGFVAEESCWKERELLWLLMLLIPGDHKRYKEALIKWRKVQARKAKVKEKI